MDGAEEDVLSYAAFRASAEGLVEQPAGAAEQGGEGEDERGGELRTRRPSSGWWERCSASGTTSGRSASATSEPERYRLWPECQKVMTENRPALYTRTPTRLEAFQELQEEHKFCTRGARNVRFSGS